MSQRRIAAALLICLLLAAPAGARARLSSRSYRSRVWTMGPRLQTFLTVERRIWPGAVVCGRFNDWRTVSVYRKTPGLHLGYDVAVPPGTPVVAAWPGRVTRILPWYQNQYGVTVLSPTGYETTYGHLVPRVAVGAAIRPGQLLGTTVIDHVDIKMLSPDGAYYDFGSDLAQADVGTPGASPSPLPAETKDTLLQAYVTALYARTQARVEVNRATERVKSARRALFTARVAARQAKQRLPNLEKYYQQGLIARKDLDDARAQVQAGAAHLHELEDDVKLARGQLELREARVAQAQADLDMLRATLMALGMKDAEIQVAVARLLRHGKQEEAAQLRRLQARERVRRRSQQHQQQSQVAKARADLERLEALYKEGAVSRNEVEAARQRLDKLTAPPAGRIKLNPRPLPPPPPPLPPPAPQAASPAPAPSPSATVPAKEMP